jgi:hypothetical protein
VKKKAGADAILSVFVRLPFIIYASLGHQLLLLAWVRADPAQQRRFGLNFSS